jgi:hypothetical protein
MESLALVVRYFHLHLATAFVAMLAATAIACRLTGVIINDAWSIGIALFATLVAIMPLLIFWQDKKRLDMREAALAIPWGLAFAGMLPLCVVAAARSHQPLQDSRFAHIDSFFGVNIPQVAGWAAHHALGNAINKTYNLLIPLMPLALFAPALAGQWKEARAYVTSNVAAFAIGVPLFWLFPAVGPWYAYNIPPNIQQLHCQSSLLLLRSAPSPFVASASGVVCFPSFHVIWAVLCWRALWGFRPLRVPVSILCTTIILSTMTTGWHYFTDVLGGLIVAAFCIAIAEWHRKSLGATYESK